MNYCPDQPLNEPDDFLSEDELDVQYNAELENYEMFHDNIS